MLTKRAIYISVLQETYENFCLYKPFSLLEKKFKFGESSIEAQT